MLLSRRLSFLSGTLVALAICCFSQQGVESYEVVDTAEFDLDDHVAPHLRAAAGEDDNVEFWPFNGGGNKSESDSCIAHTTCDACSSASWCHWCSGSQSCHVIGSVFGCVFGSDCKNHTKPPKNNDSCNSHQTCSECALSSRFCHWCAYDNACHAIGSVYGCVSGVNCFSNDRCRRIEPEPLTGVVWTQIGMIPLVIVISAASVALCCLSMCCCVTSGAKGAYDDLACLVFCPDRPADVDFRATRAPKRNRRRPPPSAPTQELMTMEPREEVDQEPEQPKEDATEEEVVQVPIDNVDSEEQPLLGDDPLQQPEPAENEYVRMNDDEAISAPIRLRRRLPTMQRMYSCCMASYFIGVIAVLGITAGTIRYYPKMPSYNFCSDAIAWGHIFDNIKSFKAEADFEFLISVKNPNHLDVVLDSGKGQFNHDGKFIGTFTIPPVRIAAMSITDAMIIAHITPATWDALSITTDYYRGKLVLTADSESKMQVPALFDYEYTLKVKDFVINVNALSDRHLCACSTWDEARNRTAIA